MFQNQPSIPSVGFLRLPQVLAIFPISKSSWWEGCRTGRYPKPVKLSARTTVWKVEDIAELISRVNNQQQGESICGECRFLPELLQSMPGRK